LLSDWLVKQKKQNEMRAFPVAGKPLRIIDDNPPLSAQEKSTGWRFFR